MKRVRCNDEPDGGDRYVECSWDQLLVPDRATQQQMIVNYGDAIQHIPAVDRRVPMPMEDIYCEALRFSRHSRRLLYLLQTTDPYLIYRTIQVVFIELDIGPQGQHFNGPSIIPSEKHISLFFNGREYALIITICRKSYGWLQVDIGHAIRYPNDDELEEQRVYFDSGLVSCL